MSKRKNPEAAPNSGKQRRSVTDKGNILSKRPRMDVSIVNNEGIKFAKSVLGRERTPTFNQFLNFLIEEGSLQILKKEGIKIATVSSNLNRPRPNATKVFKVLYDHWFHKQGNKTLYLKTIEEKGINLSSISSMLSGAGANTTEVFKDLHNLCFDGEGDKTQRLKTLEKDRVNLSNMTSALNCAGTNAAKAFKDLHNLNIFGVLSLWLIKKEIKTEYLKNMEEELESVK